MKFTSSQPSRAHCSSTIIYFYQREQNLTQFVKVLLVKLSEMLHSSNFIRLFHRQSFTLYGIIYRVILLCMCYHVAFDCTAATRKIMAHYTEILALPINLFLPRLLAKKVISFEQKDSIEVIPIQKTRMLYFIDHVIMPSLQCNSNTMFKGFLEAMEESGDQVLISMAQKLGT